MALSHCWGKSRHTKTTTDTLELYRSAIPFASLSQTFKDAVLVTRKLGVRYLWIDSLCIVQDSKSDWEAEAAQMGSIYLNSLLTIAATDAMDGDYGFLSPRTPPCPLPYHLDHAVSVSMSGNIWVAAWVTLFDDAVDQSPLSQRGWVTQERLLPPRILHFTNSQIMWECRSQTESE